MKKFLLLFFLSAFVVAVSAQDRTVSGKVTSQEDNSPLPGVNVLLKETGNGKPGGQIHLQFTRP